MRIADLERFDARAVAWFMRLFGAALVVNVATEIRAGVWDVHAGRLYPWRHLPLLPLYPTSILAIEWLVTVASGLAIVFGFRTKIAVRASAMITFVSVLERYSNHAALLFLVAFFVAMDPPDLAEPNFTEKERPNLGLVRAEIVIVYVFSALNKVVHGFEGGESLANLVGFSLGTAKVASWAVVGAEILIPLLLLRFPRLGIVAVVILHGIFAACLPGLESFGLTMVAMSLLYLRAPPREVGLPAPTSLLG